MLGRFAPIYLIAAGALGAYAFAMNRIDWLSKATLDRIFGAAPGAALRPALFMIAFGLGAFVLRISGRYAIHALSRRIDYGLRAQFLDHLHRLGTGFYRRTAPGELISRAIADLNQARLLFGPWVITVLGVAFGVVSATQVMLRISVPLTAVACLTIPIQVLALRRGSGRLFAQTRLRQYALEHLYELAQRHFAGIRLVRSLGLEAWSERRFEQGTDDVRSATQRSAHARNTMFVALNVLDSLTLLGVAWYGATLLARGQVSGGITAGGLFAFLLAWRRVATEMVAIGQVVDLYQRGQLGVGRLRAFFAIEPEVIEPVGAAPDPVDAVALRVTGLSCQVDAHPILHDVSFELPAGESLAIVGRTGAGKSTLANLLARMLPAPPGSVSLNGRDLGSLDRESLRSSIAYAPQEPFLFSTDVADNVALGLRLGPSDPPPGEALTAALVDAQIAAEVERLPQGIATQVGVRGVKLSGGQRQRIALARALVTRAPLLILDDPLSAVDARTEVAILDALKRRTAGRSLILVTNRITAAARCDRVLVLESGRVTQLGTPAALLADPGLYAELAEEQRSLPTRTEGGAEEGPQAAAVAARVSPAVEARPETGPVRVGRLTHVWPFLVRERRAFLFGLVLLVLAAGSSMMVPLSLGALAEAALHGGTLVPPLVALLLLLAAYNASQRGQVILSQLAGARAMAAMRLFLFRHTARWSMRVFDRMPTGELVAHVVSDVDAVETLFGPAVSNGLISIVALLVSMIVMLLVDARLAVIAFAALPLAVWVVALVLRRARNALGELTSAVGELSANLNEQIAGQAVIRAFGVEATMAARFDGINRRLRAAGTRAVMSDEILESALELLRLLALAAMLLWAAHLSGTSAALGFATLVAFSQYLGQFFAPLMAIGANLALVQGALASVDRVNALLAQREFEAADVAERAPEARPGAPVFAFHAVGFSYGADRASLTDLSFSARRGERVALVGPTGAGKSTVAHLLLRLYEVDTGRVEVLGSDVRAWPRAALRRAIAVIPQDVVLLTGTLLDNIALGDPTPDRARAQRALERIGLDEGVLARLGGLDASVAEGGQNFSVGERQLVAVARAAYQDAPILVLDEATASVDSKTEQLVQRALAGLLAERATLVIAHRLATIESADRILVLEEGRVLEQGTHAELLQREGLYARLWQLQRGDR